MKIYKHSRSKIYAEQLNQSNDVFGGSETIPLYSSLITLQNKAVETLGDYGLWNQIRINILNFGRGLGNPNNLDDTDREMISNIPKVAFQAPHDLVLYRTDSTNWLKSYSVGDTVAIETILQATLDKDLVISENMDNIKQRMVINVPKGTNLLCECNAQEQQVDVVSNQFYKILEISISNKIPTYTVTII